jgi:MOSC domain-containing protein YiiM
MAVLLLPLETIVQLNNEDWPVKPGDIGENFTTQGIPYEHFAIGQRYQLGESIVQIAKICNPCGNLKHLPYVGQEKKAQFIKTLLGRRGWYARVLQEGQVTVKDNILSLPD